MIEKYVIPYVVLLAIKKRKACPGGKSNQFLMGIVLKVSLGVWCNAVSYQGGALTLDDA